VGKRKILELLVPHIHLYLW